MDIEQDLDTFEDYLKMSSQIVLVQIFLSTNQIIVTLNQDHKPPELFQDPNNEKCNYPTLFFGIFRKSSILAKFRYQNITQSELMHKEHCFPKQIPNLSFKAIKVLIQQVKYASWIRIWKGKLNERILTTKQVTK
jgi:hypothetical protein